jgi:hypothetical protein
MWVTGWVRDRASGREAAMGATIFVGLVRQKWWGPVVLDAAPKPASDLIFLRESPLQQSCGKASAGPTNHFPTHPRTGILGDGGDQRPAQRNPLWPGPKPARAMR